MALIFYLLSFITVYQAMNLTRSIDMIKENDPLVFFFKVIETLVPQEQLYFSDHNSEILH